MVEDAGVQTDPKTVLNEGNFRSAVHATAKSLNLDDYSDDDEEEDWEEDDDNYISKEYAECSLP